jgi:hypothetical protein
MRRVGCRQTRQSWSSRWVYLIVTWWTARGGVFTCFAKPCCWVLLQSPTLILGKLIVPQLKNEIIHLSLKHWSRMLPMPFSTADLRTSCITFRNMCFLSFSIRTDLWASRPCHVGCHACLSNIFAVILHNQRSSPFASGRTAYRYEAIRFNSILLFIPKICCASEAGMNDKPSTYRSIMDTIVCTWRRKLIGRTSRRIPSILPAFRTMRYQHRWCIV